MSALGRRLRRPIDFVRERARGWKQTCARMGHSLVGGGLRERESQFHPQNPHKIGFWAKLWMWLTSSSELRAIEDKRLAWEYKYLEDQRKARQGGQ